jgi:hypothetical protein
VREGLHDEELLEALHDAMKARQAVPAHFIETGKNAYAWHNIDAELAQLTYDSCADKHPSASLRSEAASIRALTFTSAHLHIEVEVTDDSLIGQIIPPQAGTIEIQAQSGPNSTAPIDEIGCFAIDPVPAGAFRLHCRTDSGTEVITGWITL